MKTYNVTETVYLQKTVYADSEDMARRLAYEDLPDYAAADWSITGSDGLKIEEV